MRGGRSSDAPLLKRPPKVVDAQQDSDDPPELRWGGSLHRPGGAPALAARSLARRPPAAGDVVRGGRHRRLARWLPTGPARRRPRLPRLRLALIEPRGA